MLVRFFTQNVESYTKPQLNSINLQRTFLMKISNSILLLSSVVAPISLMAETKRPNIIIVMTDQQRADLLAREGYPLNTMPFVDSLARQGAWFNKAYTSCPASVPARTSFLTGRFPKATHVRSNQNESDAFYESDIFKVAKEKGYKTALVGKNHSFLTKDKVDYWSPYFHGGQMGGKKTATEANFDNFLKETELYASLTPSPDGVEGQLPYRMVNDASKWIANVKSDPFLMWFSISEPHNPYQVCEPYFSMFANNLPKITTTSADRKLKGPQYEQLAEMMKLGHIGYEENLTRLRLNYLGMLKLIDDQIAHLVDNLKQQGVYDNTIIVFLSDHGDYMGEYGLMKKGAGVAEALTRIPMQWTGPGIKANAKPQDACVSMVDIFPTICEIMDAEIPIGVQGRSLWPLLKGENYPKKEFESVLVEQGYGGEFYTKADGTDYAVEGAIVDNKNFFDEQNTWTQSGSRRMLRKGDWKIVMDMDGNGELYNLKNDKTELKNLFGEAKYQSIKTELMQDLLKWEISTEDPLPIPQHRYRFKRNEHNYLFCK